MKVGFMKNLDEKNTEDLNKKESKTISIISLSLFVVLILLLFIPWIKAGNVPPAMDSSVPHGGPGSSERWICPFVFLSRENGYLGLLIVCAIALALLLVCPIWSLTSRKNKTYNNRPILLFGKTAITINVLLFASTVLIIVTSAM